MPYRATIGKLIVCAQQPMVVYADMCADLMHAGHVNMLKTAKQFATRMNMPLLVGVHSSESIASYKRKPILSLQERTAMLHACKYVDTVLENAPLVITKEFMTEHNIQLVVHAHNEDDTAYDTMYAVPIQLGRFQRLNYTDSISTTEIIQRCKDSQA